MACSTAQCINYGSELLLKIGLFSSQNVIIHADGNHCELTPDFVVAECESFINHEVEHLNRASSSFHSGLVRGKWDERWAFGLPSTAGGLAAAGVVFGVVRRRLEDRRQSAGRRQCIRLLRLLGTLELAEIPVRRPAAFARIAIDRFCHISRASSTLLAGVSTTKSESTLLPCEPPFKFRWM